MKPSCSRIDGKQPAAIGTEHGQAQANREKAPFSHVFNCARDHGYTEAANPCQGVKGFKGFKEDGRDACVDDALRTR